jgi:hypothetical protein
MHQRNDLLNFGEKRRGLDLELALARMVGIDADNAAYQPAMPRTQFRDPRLAGHPNRGHPRIRAFQNTGAAWPLE